MVSTDDRHSPSPSVLAERLNELFATVTYVDQYGRRREYSTPYVAKAVSEDPTHDTTLSRVYLATLRNGTNANPTVAMLRAIAKFFNDHRLEGACPIAAAYLLGEDESDEDRQLRAKLANTEVRAIAMRAGSMSPTARHQVLRMLDVLDDHTALDNE